MMLAIALLCLTLIAALCALGVFLPMYHDNLLQRTGLAGLLLWSLSAITRAWERGWVWPEAMFLYVGLALYLGGVAYKVVKHNGRRVCRAPR